jgi:capsular exopolysaccharide synthesis family protein
MNRKMDPITPFDSFDEIHDLATPAAPVHTPPVAKHGLLSVVHHSLRGRYWLVVPLVVIFCVGGAAAGWILTHPMYRSNGAVMIQYQLDSPFLREHSRYGDGMPMYEEFLNTQTFVLMNRPTILLAMKDRAWLNTQRGNDSKAVEKFSQNLQVEHPHATQSIHIVYTDIDPGVAQAGASSIIRAYEQMYNAGDRSIQEKKLEILRLHIAQLKIAIDGEKRSIDEIASEYGTDDFSAIYRNKQQTVNNLDAQLSEAKLALTRRSGKGDTARVVDNLTMDQIGMMDSGMARKMEALANAQAEVKRLQVSFGDSNQRVREAKRVAEEAFNAAEEYAQRFRALNRKIATDPDSRGGVGSRMNQSRESLEAEVASLNDMFNKATTEMKSVGNKLRDIERHKEKVKEFQDEMHDFEHDRLLILDENKTDGRLKVLSYGEFPVVPFKDHRIAMAGVAGIGGGLVPVLLMMLFSQANKQYRYSDDAEVGRDMPPLLGILPTLPDRLNDPEQAAVAAHCIHQLRIILQVNQSKDRKVFLITSASAGDGKTSLTMALGLSFAASGSRTLVIDGDLVGQGLTTRLKARQSPGLLEALAANTLNGRIKKTTTQNLFILPVGGAESAHAGGLSPVSIRKLLAEARRVFDIVIIDTGPILGSLEAAIIGSAADAVILTLARGQHRSLVERSVRQLRQIGANIAGIVFNRAEKRDFHRSVGSASIRSLSAHPHPVRPLLAEGAEESRFGPLARSVASFMVAPKPVKEPAAASALPGEIRVEVVQQGEAVSQGSR